MGRFEGEARTIADTLERSDRQTLNKQPQVDPYLRKTVLGKLLKWMGNSKSVKPRSFAPHELTPSGLPEEFIKALSQETGTTNNSKREEAKRRKSAYSDSPSPRAPDPKSSLSSHVQVDLGAQYGPVRDALHRLNTPHPVAKISDTTEDIMRNKCDRYRLMYLVVRLEQQQEHVRDVIASIRSHSNKRDMKNMIKIKEALSKLYGTILSLRDDDVGAFLRIGTTLKDLDEFFNMVENVCSAVEDIPLEKHEPEGCHKSHGEKQVLNATDCVRPVLHPGYLKPETASQGTKLYLNEHTRRIGGKNAISIGEENVSDIDLSYDVKTVWPSLNTNDKGRQKKDKELRSLMQEIDMLMDDVGLTGADNKAVTFEEDDLGQINLGLSYLPTSEKLYLTVEDITGLKVMDRNTKSTDPCVKAFLMYDGKQLKRVKTTVRAVSLNPIFNESFSFDVPQNELDKVYFSMVVCHYEKETKHTKLIGRVYLGSNFDVTAREHWLSMMDNPRKKIVCSYKILN